MRAVQAILRTSLALNGVYRSITTAILIGVTVYSIYDGIREYKRRHKC